MTARVRAVRRRAVSAAESPNVSGSASASTGVPPQRVTAWYSASQA